MPTPQEIATNPGMNPQNMGVKRPQQSSILTKSLKGVVASKIVDTTIGIANTATGILGKII